MLINLTCDGATVMRGVSLVDVAIKVLRDKEEKDSKFRGSNSTIELNPVLMYEGKEDYEEVQAMCARMLQDMNNISENGLDVDGHKYSVTWKAGGDYKWINS